MVPLGHFCKVFRRTDRRCAGASNFKRVGRMTLLTGRMSKSGDASCVDGPVPQSLMDSVEVVKNQPNSTVRTDVERHMNVQRQQYQRACWQLEHFTLTLSRQRSS